MHSMAREKGYQKFKGKHLAFEGIYVSSVIEAVDQVLKLSILDSQKRNPNA